MAIGESPPPEAMPPAKPAHSHPDLREGASPRAHAAASANGGALPPVAATTATGAPGGPGGPGGLDGAPPAPVTAASVLNPRRWGSTFTSLAERDYAWYFAGNIGFFMGMQMQFVLRGYLAWELTGSAVALGAIAAMIALPMLIVAPFGGVVADRVDKGLLLILTQSSAALAAGLMAFLTLSDLLQFWHLLAVSLATGFIFSFNMPARQAMVPQLVPPHKLMNAVSLQMGGMNLTRIIAPSVGAALIAPISAGGVYLVVLGFFILATLSELKLPKHGLKAAAQTQTPSSFIEDFTGGFSYIWQRPMLRTLVVTSLLIPLFGFPVQQMLPVIADEVFDSPDIGLGFLASSSGAGGLVGAIVAANMDGQPAKGRLMLIGGVFMGLFLITFAVAPALWLAMLLLAAAGIGQMVFMATNNSVVQAGVPAEIRGRVMSVMMMSFGMMPLGVIPVTLAADQFGARWAIAGSSTVLLVVLAAVAVLVPRIRNLRVEAFGQSEMSPSQAATLVAEGKMTQEEADRVSSSSFLLE